MKLWRRFLMNLSIQSSPFESLWLILFTEAVFFSLEDKKRLIFINAWIMENLCKWMIFVIA